MFITVGYEDKFSAKTNDLFIEIGGVMGAISVVIIFVWLYIKRKKSDKKDI